MAANDTAALVVALSAQLTKFERDMDNAVGIADRGARKIEDRFNAVNPGFGELSSKLTSLLTIGGIAAALSKLQDLVAETAKIGDQAERVGLTVAQFQALRFAAASVGAPIETAGTFMDKFSRSIAEAAQGQGDLYKIFQLNNVALRDQSGQLLPANALLLKFADLVKNSATAQERMNLAVLGGGRAAGPEFVAALNQGSQGLQKFAEDADKAGLAGEDLVARAKKMQEDYAKLKLTLGAFWEEFAVGIAEAIKKQNELNNLIARNAFDSIKDAWKGVVDYINTNRPDIAEFFKSVSDDVKKELSLPIFRGDPNAPRRGAEILSATPTDPRLAPPALSGNGSTVQINVQADAFKKLIDLQEERIKLLDAERAAIGLTAGEATRLKTQIELETQARKENIPLTDARKAAIAAEAQKTGEAAQALDDYKRRWAGLNSAVQFAGDQAIDILDGLRNKTLTAGQAVVQLGNAFIHAAEQALLLGSGPLAGIFGTAAATTGGTGGILGALFGLAGTRAGGGPVQAGKSFLVGEQGPEIFVPQSPGNIVPNNVASSQAGGGAIIVSVTSNNQFAQGVTPTDMAAISAMVDQKDQKNQVAIVRAIRQGNRNDSSFLTKG